MPGACSARLLRALVLCTISTTTTASAVVLVDGFLTGKTSSQSLEYAPRRQFRPDEFFPPGAPAQIRGRTSSSRIDAGLVAALQACWLKSPATLVPFYVDCSDALLSPYVHFCWFSPHVQASSAQYPEQNLNTFPASTHSPMSGRPSWTCLLYTSPSPRDKRQSRMPSSA